MKIERKTKEQLRREIYSLRRGLRADIKEIKTEIGEDGIYPTWAIDQMRPVETLMRKKAVKYMKKGELQSIYRKLTHIRQLKTSKLEGVKSVAEHLKSNIPNITKLSNEQLKKLWASYGKLVGELKILKDYKYDVYTALADVATQAELSDEELAIRVESLYNKATRGVLDDNETTDETDKILLRSFEPILRKN